MAWKEADDCLKNSTETVPTDLRDNEGTTKTPARKPTKGGKRLSSASHRKHIVCGTTRSIAWRQSSESMWITSRSVTLEQVQLTYLISFGVRAASDPSGERGNFVDKWLFTRCRCFRPFGVRSSEFGVPLLHSCLMYFGVPRLFLAATQNPTESHLFGVFVDVRDARHKDRTFPHFLGSCCL